MLDVSKITEGLFNSATNRNEELYESRVSICRECKLITHDRIFGEVCNSRLYINPSTEETSKRKKPGFINGCGCVLNSKCRVPSAHCPIGRW